MSRLSRESYLSGWCFADAAAAAAWNISQCDVIGATRLYRMKPANDSVKVAIWVTDNNAAISATGGSFIENC
jgi:hypothetical protein